MKIMYIDCGMGCAGDMLMAALLELHPDRALPWPGRPKSVRKAWKNAA